MRPVDALERWGRLAMLCALALVAPACGDDDDDDAAGDGDADADGDGDGDADGDGDGDGDADCGADTTSDDPEFGPLVELMKAKMAAHQVPGGAMVTIRDFGTADQRIDRAVLGVQRAGQCDPVTEDTMFRSGLAASWLTAFAVAEAGLDLDAPVRDTFIDGLATASGDASAITLGQLLNWRAGVPWWDDPSCGTLDEMVGDLADQPLWSEPGRVMYWSGWSTALAGLALTGLHNSTYATYDEAMQGLLFDPLDMSATFDVAEAEAIGLAWSDTQIAGWQSCEAHHPWEELYLSLADAEKVLTWLLEDPRILALDQAHTVNADAAIWQIARGMYSSVMDGHRVFGLFGSVAGYEHFIAIVPDLRFAAFGIWSGFSEFDLATNLWLGSLESMVGLTEGVHALALPPDRWSEYVGRYTDPIGVGHGPRTVDVTLDGEALHIILDPAGEAASVPLALEPWSDWPGSTDADNFSFEAPDGTRIRVRFWREGDAPDGLVDLLSFIDIGPAFRRVAE